MKQTELDLILDEHKKWLKGEGGRRADLRKANLYKANLYKADLSHADLSHADLSHADLSHADLSHADLSYADLSHADLRKANLYKANLHKADYMCDGKFHHITNVGSESGTLELYSCGEKGWFIRRGCFSGSKDEFLSAVAETHKDNDHAKKYRAIIELFCA